MEKGYDEENWWNFGEIKNSTNKMTRETVCVLNLSGELKINRELVHGHHWDNCFK